jgi:hypothetical protein
MALRLVDRASRDAANTVLFNHVILKTALDKRKVVMATCLDRAERGLPAAPMPSRRIYGPLPPPHDAWHTRTVDVCYGKPGEDYIEKRVGWIEKAFPALETFRRNGGSDTVSSHTGIVGQPGGRAIRTPLLGSGDARSL